MILKTVLLSTQHLVGTPERSRGTQHHQANQETSKQISKYDYCIRLRLEKWNRILGIICLLISILTSIKLYYQKASVRTDAGQMPDRCSFFNTV